MFWYRRKLSVIISFSYKGSGFLSENFTIIKRLIKSFLTIRQESVNTKTLMPMIFLEFTFFFTFNLNAIYPWNLNSKSKYRLGSCSPVRDAYSWCHRRVVFWPEGSKIIIKLNKIEHPYFSTINIIKKISNLVAPSNIKNKYWYYEHEHKKTLSTRY